MNTRVTRSSARLTKNENVKENSRPEHPNTNQHNTQTTSKPSEALPKNSVVVTSSNSKKSESTTDKNYETIEEKQNGEVIRRYLKGKLLGRGGFAKAYWATCLATQKQYALKVVLKSSLTKPKAKAKLQAEVKIHSTLKHAYVVRFYHFFEDNECYYMLLELCHNRSFSELMKKRKRLTEPEVQYFFIQIIEALIYMHGIGVIHRDLKLGNLLLDKNMNVKIGDLGLAARVSDAGERKRTLCGTPNYIAPEILENKHGHSFQVDIWSAGVVLYTMLVGRPPYESKDIKTTYKKILANDFSFPEHVELSASARDLICSMLQTKPEKRPSLESIAAHSFFNRKESPMPSSIPVSALVSVPTFNDSNQEENTSSSTASSSSNNKTSSKKESTMKKDEASVPTTVPPSSSTTTATTASDGRRSSSNAELLKPLTKSLKSRQPEVISVEVANNKMSNTRTPLESNHSNRNGTKKIGHVVGQTSSAVSDVDKVISTVVSEKRLGEVKKSESLVRNLDFDNKAELDHHRRHSKSSNKDMEANKVKKTTTMTSSSSKIMNHEANPLLGSGELDDIEGGGEDVDNEVFDKKKFISSTTSKTSTQLKRSNSVSSRSATAAAPQPSEKAPVNNSSPLRAAADPLANTQGSGGDMGTLESIHRNLAQTMANLENGGSDMAATSSSATSTKSRKSESSASSKLPVTSPTQWVTQYVDYTSKYGLGYLLVDGSTGVYFNDSTKIVLGSEGHHFTYLERVRTEKSSYERIEHHTLSSYPPTLHKKVTLLQHFRDYLLQQQKEKSEKNGDKPQPRTVWTDNSSSNSENGSDQSKVFVKKWVRTRHAILFRLSNQNIQVMFLDNTEILLSNEAKVVTFLDKQGVRRTMHSSEVVQSPRNDITKRLKYTKDILRQLITNAKR